MSNERIEYYIIRTKGRNLDMSHQELYDKIFNQTMESQKAWHETYGKDGFGSERTHEDMFEIKSRQAAHNAVQSRKLTYQEYPAAVSDETWPAVKQRIERLPNFHCWSKDL